MVAAGRDLSSSLCSSFSRWAVVVEGRFSVNKSARDGPPPEMEFFSFLAVLWIHDILVWIRIWIRGSMPLTNGSGSGFGSGSCYLRLWLSKLIYTKSFSAYYFLKVHLYHFSKIESQKEVTKQQESRFSLVFLLGDIRIRIHTSDKWIRVWIPEAPKHTDLTDPDSEVSGYKLESSQSLLIVWFSTFIFLFYKMLFMSKLEFSCFADFFCKDYKNKSRVWFSFRSASRSDCEWCKRLDSEYHLWEAKTKFWENLTWLSSGFNF